MKNLTHITIAGLGSSPGSVTVDVINAAKSADVLIVPRSDPEKPGRAETIIASHIQHKPIIPLTFPMTQSSPVSALIAQLQPLVPKLEGTSIFFPTIGDVTLYSTACYFVEAMRNVFVDVDVDFLPGISAHSIAASRLKIFLAMTDDILTIIPGTASREKIIRALDAASCAVIYKPSAITDLHALIDVTQWREIYRVDNAGTIDERITEGANALDGGEYMSVIVLRR